MKVNFALICFVTVLQFSQGKISFAAEMQQVDRIDLSKPSDVEDAKKLSAALNAVSKKVTECVNNKLAQPSECSCRYPDELEQLKNAYENTLKLHPAWHDHLLFWYRDDTHSYSHNLSLKSLRVNVFENKCPTLRSSGTPQKRGAP